MLRKVCDTRGFKNRYVKIVLIDFSFFTIVYKCDMFPVSWKYNGDVCIQRYETLDFHQKILTLPVGTISDSVVRCTPLNSLVVFKIMILLSDTKDDCT